MKILTDIGVHWEQAQIVVFAVDCFSVILIKDFRNPNF